MKIQVWSTSDNGNGYVQSLGIYDDLEDIKILAGQFKDNVLITFNYIPDAETNPNTEIL